MAIANKVLVIGSEGFIGKNIVSGLLARGFQLWGADLIDIKPKAYQYYRIGRLQPEFEQLFKGHQFNYCINAAGSGSVPISIAEPHRDFEANVVDTFKLLNSIRLYNSHCKYIHFSSAAVYGNPLRLPIKEEDILAPVSPYGYHKWVSEIICREFMALYNLPIVILRPFSAYGPGLRKQLIWDLYQKFASNENVYLHGTGKETRDFIYVDDIVSIIVTIMKGCDFKGDVFNIASGISKTIKEVSEVFNAILEEPKEILFNNIPDEGTPLFWKADISKIKNLGFEPAFNLQQGLVETIKWIKKNG